MSNEAGTTALITGVAGQDGVLLARHLLAGGTRVVGTVRPGGDSAAAMAPYLDGVVLAESDVRDVDSFAALLEHHRPAEVYHLAGFTSVGASWDQPELVTRVNAVAVEAMLATLLAHRDRTGADVRFLQASSSQQDSPASSPYAAAKARAHEAVLAHRREHGLFACAAVLHNHESPLRGRRFVTRRITDAAARIARGLQDSLTLGNLDTARDWGSARDYVQAMPLLLRREEPVDVALATGVLHTLEDLLVRAFAAAGLGDPWPHVRQDPGLLRPADTPVEAGDPGPARELLGWAPRDTFEDVVDDMVRVDLLRVDSGVAESASYLRD